MTRGEARRLAELIDDAVRPGAGLPAARGTDAIAAFDAWLRSVPRVNALALRVLLRIVARGRGDGARETRPADARGAAAADLLRRLALHCYYGDARVMAALGYDADAIVARAAALRAARGQP